MMNIYSLPTHNMMTRLCVSKHLILGAISLIFIENKLMQVLLQNYYSKLLYFVTMRSLCINISFEMVMFTQYGAIQELRNAMGVGVGWGVSFPEKSVT